MTPLHVIGGYLGSGKTTLVNHLLADADGRRVAVLVNDFGDIDVDGALIASADDDVISLANGCVCCSLADGLVTAFAAVRERAAHLDRVVVEASGVADPASIVRFGVASGFAVGRVVVVVDTATVRRRAADRYVGDTVLRQIEAADVCVVNKVDLVGAADVERVHTWLAGIAPDAEQVDTVRCELDWAILDGATIDRHDGSSVDHAEAHHARTIEYDEPVDRARLQADIEELPETVVRVKGVVAFADDPDRAWSVQRVGAGVELERLTARPPDRTRIVVISAGPD